MSFLINDNDDVATLEETLAFIDSLYLENTPVAASSTESDLYNPLSQDSHIGQDVETVKLNLKKRKRTNLSSSTRLHQRKKAEMLYLRRRVQELEESIEQLKTKRRISVDPSMEGTWMKVAKDHFQARLRSEETNRSLKSIMASQIQVSDTLRDIIQEQVSFQTKDLTSTTSTVVSRVNESRSQLFDEQMMLNLNSKEAGLNTMNFALENNDNSADEINQAMITASTAIPLPTLNTFTLSL